MVVNKAYKFRIYPNKKQAELINKTIGCARFVFNRFLGKQKDKKAYLVHGLTNSYKTVNFQRIIGKANT